LIRRTRRQTPVNALPHQLGMSTGQVQTGDGELVP
jgi:hypothetical protein